MNYGTLSGPFLVKANEPIIWNLNFTMWILLIRQRYGSIIILWNEKERLSIYSQRNWKPKVASKSTMLPCYFVMWFSPSPKVNSRNEWLDFVHHLRQQWYGFWLHFTVMFDAHDIHWAYGLWIKHELIWKIFRSQLSSYHTIKSLLCYLVS